MNKKIKLIILVYAIFFITLSIFITPYKILAYYDGEAIFLGERGNGPVTEFNNITEKINAEAQRLNKPGSIRIIYIDWQVLNLELLTLTVMTVCICLIFKDKKLIANIQIPATSKSE